MAASVMATACAIARMAIAKTVSNLNVSHTPPPTGSLPVFRSENKNTGRNK